MFFLTYSVDSEKVHEAILCVSERLYETLIYLIKYHDTWKYGNFNDFFDFFNGRLTDVVFDFLKPILIFLNKKLVLFFLFY